MKSQQIPGVAVAVVENGTLVLARAWGYAHVKTGTVLDTSAVFELASVTKQFTAAALMLLVEQSKVGMDDSISKYLEQAPETWARITVRMLLSHTSGLPIDGFPDYEGSPLLQITSKQGFGFIAFPPGEDGTTPPRHVIAVTVGGKSIWGQEPIERLVYCALPAGNVQPRLTIG